MSHHPLLRKVDSPPSDEPSHRKTASYIARTSHLTVYHIRHTVPPWKRFSIDQWRPNQWPVEPDVQCLLYTQESVSSWRAYWKIGNGSTREGAHPQVGGMRSRWLDPRRCVHCPQKLDRKTPIRKGNAEFKCVDAPASTNSEVQSFFSSMAWTSFVPMGTKTINDPSNGIPLDPPLTNVQLNMWKHLI